MINVGSISEQTLAGTIATATHGSGIAYGVMSTQVMALTLLLADGSRITCSGTEHRDLFIASICGLGSTGLIISIQLQVEPAFRLKEMQETLAFDEFVERFDDLVHSAEHVRFWWYPPSGVVRCSYYNRTQEVFIFRIEIGTTSLILRNSLAAKKSRRKLVLECFYGIPHQSISPLSRSVFFTATHLDFAFSLLVVKRTHSRCRRQPCHIQRGLSCRLFISPGQSPCANDSQLVSPIYHRVGRSLSKHPGVPSRYQHMVTTGTFGSQRNQAPCPGGNPFFCFRRYLAQPK